MTKKYIAFTDNVLPVRKPYTSADEGNIAKVTLDGGEYVLKVVPAGTSSVAWSDVTAKPFTSIGAGLSVDAGTGELSADTQLHFEILDIATHPASASYKNTIALELNGSSETGNVYREYACVKTSDSPETWAWEKLGDITASVDQTTGYIRVNGTALQNATASRIGVLSSTDWSTFNGKQSAVPAGTPGEVLTNSGTAGTFGTSIGFDTAPTASSNNLLKSGVVKTALDAKVDKDSASTVVFKVGCDSTGPYVEY